MPDVSAKEKKKKKQFPNIRSAISYIHLYFFIVSIKTE